MTTTAISRDQIRDLVRQELDDLVRIRRDLHAHPELAYEEHRTSELVQKQLQQAGITFTAGLAGGTGVVGHLPGEADRATGLRADMDALPILEETGLDYASQNEGVMHACGHDGHTTILLGAARVLAKIARHSPLPRPVTLIFQPAEEGGAGGRRMVEDGCLDGTLTAVPVAHMFGLHGWPRLPLGIVGSRAGALLAAADMFDLTISGRGSHAAFPHLGHDPIVAGAAIVGAFQTIASRSTDPLDSIVVSVTQFHCGTTHNIIADEAQLNGTVRTLRPETQCAAIERLSSIAEGVAAAHGCRALLHYQEGYPVTLNDPAAFEVFRAAAQRALGNERVVDVPQPFMGAEDFSFYCHEVPSCFFILGLLPKDQEAMADLHQPRFNFNDDAIATGVEMFCALALRQEGGG